MSNTENISEIYFNELKITEKPAVTLAKFVWEVLSLKPVNTDIAKMSKLVKLYGRNDVFAGILDLADVDEVGSNYYPLLVYFIKKRLEKRNGDDIILTDLSEYINKVKTKTGVSRKFRVLGPSEIKE